MEGVYTEFSEKDGGASKHKQKKGWREYIRKHSMLQLVVLKCIHVNLIYNLLITHAILQLQLLVHWYRSLSLSLCLFGHELLVSFTGYSTPSFFAFFTHAILLTLLNSTMFSLLNSWVTDWSLFLDLFILACTLKISYCSIKNLCNLMSFNTKRPGVSITRISVCRNSDVATRKKYANLVDSVKDSGGTVHIFSSLHVSGEREYYFVVPWFLLCLKPI